MDNKKLKKIILVVVLILIAYFSLQIYDRYSRTETLEELVSWTGNQEEYSTYREEEDFLFYVYRTEETPNYLHVWERDSILKSRFIQNIGLLDYSEEDVDIENIQGSDKWYIVVYGYNNPEKLIENYTVNINGKVVTKKPEEGLILEIFEASEPIHSLREIKYKQ